MASIVRLKTWKDESALRDVIKAHIKEEPYKTSEIWNQGDLDDVVEAYELFLSTIAETGHKLSKQVLVCALRKQFKSDAATLLNFSTKLILAEQHCRAKCQSFVDGSRLHPSVKNVVLVMLKAKPNKEQQG